MAHFAIAGNPIASRPMQNGLYLVATPIGNLGDITLRALETLAGADLIACEDTRVTGKLLRHFAIHAPMTAYHEHNAEKAGAALLDKLAAGAAVALTSDAGTPLVSDPGFRLVASARERGIQVYPIPGPSAPIAALVASGLSASSFFFGGFLPNRAKARQDRLRELADVPGALVFFESPNRLLAALADIGLVLADSRRICVAREITKLHEEFQVGTPGELAAHFENSRVRGEIVVIIEPPTKTENPANLDQLLRRLLETESVSRAAALAARQSGIPRKSVYARALALSVGGKR